MEQVKSGNYNPGSEGYHGFHVSEYLLLKMRLLNYT